MGAYFNHLPSSLLSLDDDIQLTLANLERLEGHSNLMQWYQLNFERQFRYIEVVKPRVLEIGSGASPLKHFRSKVMTSDIMPLPNVDFQLDALKLSQVDSLEDGSLDGIVMTNVLHHLARPMDFFMEALPKLKVGGKIVLTEPYFTPLSRPIYRFLHHEPVDFNVEKPELDVGEGPLSSSNQALPYLIFQQREDWKRCLEKHYILDEPQVFTGLSYFATGGISRQLFFPPALYKIALNLDDQLARRLPSLWGSFFIQSCTKR